MLFAKGKDKIGVIRVSTHTFMEISFSGDFVVVQKHDSCTYCVLVAGDPET